MFSSCFYQVAQTSEEAVREHELPSLLDVVRDGGVDVVRGERSEQREQQRSSRPHVLLEVPLSGARTGTAHSNPQGVGLEVWGWWCGAGWLWGVEGRGGRRRGGLILERTEPARGCASERNMIRRVAPLETEFQRSEGPTHKGIFQCEPIPSS